MDLSKDATYLVKVSRLYGMYEWRRRRERSKFLEGRMHMKSSAVPEHTGGLTNIPHEVPKTLPQPPQCDSKDVRKQICPHWKCSNKRHAGDCNRVNHRASGGSRHGNIHLHKSTGRSSRQSVSGLRLAWRRADVLSTSRPPCALDDR